MILRIAEDSESITDADRGAGHTLFERVRIDYATLFEPWLFDGAGSDMLSSSWHCERTPGVLGVYIAPISQHHVSQVTPVMTMAF